MWLPVTKTEPKNYVSVLTRINDGRGIRNEQKLRRSGNIWFIESGEMYVYYSPTEYFSEVK